MIGRGSIEREPEELFKGQPVVDLIFEFGIGVDAEPLLKEHTLEKQQRRVRIGTFTAGTDGIVSHQDLFNALPIDSVIERIHKFEAAIVL
jgi:hypothetical protein